MSNFQERLEKIAQIDGFMGVALVDSDSGMMLGAVGGSEALNLEVAAAGNTQVVRAKRKAMGSLNLRDEIEDILVTLGKQYHLIRPLKSRPGVFFYVALDRTRANLALARLTLADAEKDVTFLVAPGGASLSSPGRPAAAARYRRPVAPRPPPGTARRAPRP